MPNVWYVVYYDPDAVLKAVEVKFGAGKKMDVDVKFTRTVAIIRLTANEGGLRRGTDFQIAAKSTGKNYHPWVP